MRRLLLSRHGQTPNNNERRFTGWSDAELTTEGRRQARALGRRLRDQRIDAVYSSDLRRASETARITLQARAAALRRAGFVQPLPTGAGQMAGAVDDHGSSLQAPSGGGRFGTRPVRASTAVSAAATPATVLEPVQSAALREANFGEWQGLTFDEAQVRNPGRFTALLQRSEDFRPPGGETIREVRDRVVAFLDEARARHAGQTVLVVASGGPLQILLTVLIGMPTTAHWRLGMGNCNLSIVDFARDEPLLTLLNDRAHLRPA